MSPLLHDQLRVGFCPDRLVLVGYRRGLRPAIARREVVAVHAAEDAPRQAAWQPALDALPRAVEALSEKSEVAVILSNAFVRYALLDWSTALKTRVEWTAYATHRLATVHGGAMDAWDVRLTDTGPRAPRIACAVERALLDGLEACVSARGARLVSVQPYLVAAFNRVRRQLGARSAWLAVEEPGRLTLALIENERWRAIRSRRVEPGWQAGLSELLARESALIGLDEPCLRVALLAHDDGTGPAELATQLPELDAAIECRDLTLPAGAADSERSLAMVLA